jgi:hypothetical protein
MIYLLTFVDGIARRRRFNSCGGGHLATVIVSPKAKKGFQSTNTYQHQSTLRLILVGSGVNSFPGLSAVAPDMTKFFTAP